ncbi:pelargonidin 3-O-(6-caffeoylglucoside) 5-O-(6-O-malonylglucoside) 4'''-malonyltransferase-like [Salvia splendens]|uniref:pelargonidin 3-O-(6-caffeoylglucoside) 5-O-(6-O-malonylglucoside) 4'''-malonyltransferase-like n=1 Tax=Salvia splendens TaxID=180675 RepID=UPI001C26CE21|nr:pelargonidin 3-O-(6-caffeoylglucoside) 5-O-(6-O-malonylglucoside) 4'''-malonyltransferase-like [Salvia splendens]
MGVLRTKLQNSPSTFGNYVFGNSPWTPARGCRPLNPATWGRCPRILVDFYPLAGRYIKEQSLVHCNDDGAEFVTTQATGVDLNDVTGTNDTDILQHVYPDSYYRCDEDGSNPLLSIQATHFPCGGAIIAVNVSHRIFDIPSITTFISVWSSVHHPNKSVQVTPSFNIPSLLPCKEHRFGVNLKRSSAEEPKIVAKRLLFDKAALASLKSKLKPDTISDGEIVSGVIAKALVRLDWAKHGKNREFVVFQPINMRERTIPPQSKHACANLTFTTLTAPVAASEKIEVQEIVDVIGEGVRANVAELAGILSRDTDGRDIIIKSLGSLMKAISNRETNFIVFSDCNEFEFYEADFGWGKPVWMTITPQRLRSNATVLTRNREGDGIEAWVHLYQDDMPRFQEDEDITPFAH